MPANESNEGRPTSVITRALLAALQRDLNSERLQKSGYHPKVLDLVSPDSSKEIRSKLTLIRLLERHSHVLQNKARRQFNRQELHAAMADLGVPSKGIFVKTWLKPLGDMSIVLPGLPNLAIDLNHFILREHRIEG